MNSPVSTAIEEVRAAFPDHRIEVEPDGEGGARVTVHALDLGPRLDPSISWVGFHITHAHPHADIYPHYCMHGLRRRDGTALPVGFHPSDQQWRGATATMLSRRSNRWNPAHDNAALKLTKVLDWVRAA